VKASKARKPAAAAAANGLRVDQPSGKINPNAILDAFDFQAALITRRFRMSPSLAAIVAAHAFPIDGRRA
jgi:hypothetical protein